MCLPKYFYGWNAAAWISLFSWELVLLLTDCFTAGPGSGYNDGQKRIVTFQFKVRSWQERRRQWMWTFNRDSDLFTWEVFGIETWSACHRRSDHVWSLAGRLATVGFVVVSTPRWRAAGVQWRWVRVTAGGQGPRRRGGVRSQLWLQGRRDAAGEAQRAKVQEESKTAARTFAVFTCRHFVLFTYWRN